MNRHMKSGHPWNVRPMWKKRLWGWLMFQVASWSSLFCPVRVDKLVQEGLNNQYPIDRFMDY